MLLLHELHSIRWCFMFINSGQTLRRQDAKRATRPLSETPECQMERVTKLRALAARYRSLAETLFDPALITVVQECAGELEFEAVSIDQNRILVP